MHYYVVDVFSGAPFMGNPVAVVMCDKKMHRNEMQQIAAWINLSETTFVSDFSETESRYKVRIFSPKGEMPFAGHPTLGTAAAVRKHFNFDGRTIKQDCPAGLIDIRFDEKNESIHLIAPDPSLKTISKAEKDQLATAFSLNKQIETVAIIDAAPVWITALLTSSETIEKLQPNFELIKSLSDQLKATGVVLGAIQPDGKTFKVRTFAPSVGVQEDPVCGSGNVAVAFLRAQNGVKPDNYFAKQGQEMGRDGEIQIAYLDSSKIELGGKTIITASGEILTNAL